MPCTRARTEFRGIVFDLDGVLMDSSSCHKAAFEQVFGALGVANFEYAPYAGWRTAEVVADVLLRAGRPAGADAVTEAAREKSRLARQMIRERKPLTPGCLDLLTELARDYRLGLASSGSRESVELFLDLSGARSLFQTVLSGDDVALAKPHPEIYTRAIGQLGLEPADCVIVEDAVAGVEAARAAGAAVIGIAGTCAAETLRAAGAETVVSRLSDLKIALSEEADVRS